MRKRHQVANQNTSTIHDVIERAVVKFRSELEEHIESYVDRVIGRMGDAEVTINLTHLQVEEGESVRPRVPPKELAAPEVIPATPAATPRGRAPRKVVTVPSKPAPRPRARGGTCDLRSDGGCSGDVEERACPRGCGRVWRRCRGKHFGKGCFAGVGAHAKRCDGKAADEDPDPAMEAAVQVAPAPQSDLPPRVKSPSDISRKLHGRDQPREAEAVPVLEDEEADLPEAAPPRHVSTPRDDQRIRLGPNPTEKQKAALARLTSVEERARILAAHLEKNPPARLPPPTPRIGRSAVAAGTIGAWPRSSRNALRTGAAAPETASQAPLKCQSAGRHGESCTGDVTELLCGIDGCSRRISRCAFHDAQKILAHHRVLQHGAAPPREKWWSARIVLFCGKCTKHVDGEMAAVHLETFHEMRPAAARAARDTWPFRYARTLLEGQGQAGSGVDLDAANDEDSAADPDGCVKASSGECDGETTTWTCKKCGDAYRGCAVHRAGAGGLKYRISMHMAGHAGGRRRDAAAALSKSGKCPHAGCGFEAADGRGLSTHISTKHGKRLTERARKQKGWWNAGTTLRCTRCTRELAGNAAAVHLVNFHEIPRHEIGDQLREWPFELIELGARGPGDDVEEHPEEENDVDQVGEGQDDELAPEAETEEEDDAA